MMDWSTLIDEIREPMRAVFEHLHAHPEISWEEVETTKFLTAELQQLRVNVTTYPGETGLVAEWGPVNKPVVALRTDIDALWQEVDGTWRANHSCGHDAHMTVILGAVRLLNQALPNPPVRIRAIFQPAEETGAGALKMVERGALEDVVYLFGLHLRPIEELATGKFSAAIRNGGAIQIDGTVTGVAAHAARPHLGVNAIEAAFAGYQAVQGIHMNPMVPHSVKMTQIRAGGKSTNIIPDVARFSYDLRAQTNEVLDSLTEQVEYRVRQASHNFGATVEFQRSERTMAAQIGPAAQAILAKAIAECVGSDAVVMEIVTPGAEDFHYYTAARPDLQATMLGVGCNLAPGLHHPHMHFDRETLWDSIVILADAVVKASQTMTNVR